MNVLSLFDGMSCGQIALERAGIEVDKYYASEIDKYAIQVAQKNYPNTIQLGDMTKWREWDIDFSSIDLLTAGFPCQAWSMAGKQQGDSDPRGALVHELIAIWQEIKKHNPDVKFLFENVKMKKEFLDYINDLFGVEPIMINSALVSAQNRKRYYWTNIENIEQPADLQLLASDIIDPLIITPNSDGWQKWWTKNKEFQLKKGYSCFLNDIEKSITLTARQMSSWNGCLVRTASGDIRFATPQECEKLQTIPHNYTEGVSNTQRYKMIGNGWTVDVIAHIFKNLNK